MPNVRLPAALIAVSLCGLAFGQEPATSEDDALRIAALEALMDAPPERALPPVRRVLTGNFSDEVKEGALFILSQIEGPEALELLLEFARNENGPLKSEAIQVIGIAGHTDGIEELKSFYANGDAEVRNAVLEAYLIADRPDAVYDLALAADDEKELSQIVEVLGAMGAVRELRQLLGQVDVTEGLIDAYAIAGDFESLRALAADAPDRRSRVRAIEALGMIGSDEAKDALVTIFRNADDRDIREAAVSGMIIADHEEGVLSLYREASSARAKGELLEALRAMDSEALWDLVDEALSEED